MGADLIVGFIAGVAATYFYQILLILKKPKFVLASEISLEHLDKHKGKNRFSFKILNQGKNQIVDITLKAWVCELETIDGCGVSRGIFELPIINSNTRTLAPAGKSDRPWGLTSESELSATTDEDVLGMLEPDDRVVMVTAKATDAISGTTVVKQQIYKKEHVRRGKFSCESNLNIQ